MWGRHNPLIMWKSQSRFQIANTDAPVRSQNASPEAVAEITNTPTGVENMTTAYTKYQNPRS